MTDPAVSALATALRSHPHPTEVGILHHRHDHLTFSGINDECLVSILAALPADWRLVDMDALVERVARLKFEQHVGARMVPIDGVWDEARESTRSGYRAEARRLLGVEP